MSKDNKVSTLTKATVKAITEIATAQAIKAYNDEKKSDVQKYHDRRYKNTKLKSKSLKWAKCACYLWPFLL